MQSQVNKVSTRKVWKPSAAIKSSAVLHVGALAGLAVGLTWPWALGGLLANHALLTTAGLWPRSTLLGSNMLRLSRAACDAQKIAITIDDGPDPQVTPECWIFWTRQTRMRPFSVSEQQSKHIHTWRGK